MSKRKHYAFRHMGRTRCGRLSALYQDLKVTSRMANVTCEVCKRGLELDRERRRSARERTRKGLGA